MGNFMPLTAVTRQVERRYRPVLELAYGAVRAALTLMIVLNKSGRNMLISSQWTKLGKGIVRIG